MIEGSSMIGRERRCRLELEGIIQNVTTISWNWKLVLALRYLVLNRVSCMAVTYTVLCPGLFMCALRCSTTSLLVQLLRALLELLLAGWLAKVVGDDRARVGLVVLKSGGTTAGSLGVDVVVGVCRRVQVAGLLCDLVGDAYSSVNYAFVIVCELLMASLLPVASSSLGWTGMLMDLFCFGLVFLAVVKILFG